MVRAAALRSSIHQVLDLAGETVVGGIAAGRQLRDFAP